MKILFGCALVVFVIISFFAFVFVVYIGVIILWLLLISGLFVFDTFAIYLNLN